LAASTGCEKDNASKIALSGAVGVSAAVRLGVALVQSFPTQTFAISDLDSSFWLDQVSVPIQWSPDTDPEAVGWLGTGQSRGVYAVVSPTLKEM
jgi:hypothetical protein